MLTDKCFIDAKGDHFHHFFYARSLLIALVMLEAKFPHKTKPCLNYFLIPALTPGLSCLPKTKVKYIKHWISEKDRRCRKYSAAQITFVERGQFDISNG